jgi:cysteine desulfurase/selenocysteine lyase
LLNEKTKLVSITHISNVLGTINPIKEIINAAHNRGALVFIDAAQSIHHVPIDVQDLDCDFLVFSSHKMYGPTGVGVLYGKQSWLNAMPPYQGGGDMISEVSFEKTTYNALPFKFEAGTPNISGVIGLGAAIDFLNDLGMKTIQQHEAQLCDYLLTALQSIPGLKIIGEANDRIGVVSFTLDAIHAHDIATILDRQGVAIRAGHHCAMPLMNRFHVAATARASLAIYNTVNDIDALIAAIETTQQVFV